MATPSPTPLPVSKEGRPNFLGGPTPDVKFLGPSKDYRPDKLAFAATRLARWFK